MAQLGVGAEMADLAEMNDGLWPLVAKDVLELLLEHVDDVDLDVLRGGPPTATRVGSDHLVGVGHAAGEQPTLAAGDSGDEKLFHVTSATGDGFAEGSDAFPVAGVGASA